MNQNLNKEKENARLLLFANFGVTVENAEKYLEDMEKNPHKIPNYTWMLHEIITKQYDHLKEKPIDEIEQMARDRVKEWKELIGEVTIHEFVTMSKQWDIPIDNIIDRKITPELIKEMLDHFVIGQDRYKTLLAVTFYSYKMAQKQTNVFLPKSNLLVCGPSGSGKTYGMQVLSKLFHVPFVPIHCNSLVQEGIVGSSISDGFTSLLSQGHTKEELEMSVVCFDEFDKLFGKKGGDNEGTYNARIINEMLNVIDDNGEVECKTSFNSREDNRIKLRTRKMMFVFTGVFEGLKEIRKQSSKKPSDKKLISRPIGFMASAQQPVEEEQPIILDDLPTIEDFIEFGVKPEIVGRIRNYVFLDELNEEQMVHLFDLGINSPFSDFKEYFTQNGIDTILTEEGKRALARLACQKKLGVRGLKSLLQEVLLEDMYDLDVGKENILVVTKEYIMENLKKKN